MKSLAIDGVKLCFRDEGTGIPLLFVHGFPFSGSVWKPQELAFTSRYRVITPDLRGMGESDAEPRPTPMARFAEDLSTLLEHLHTGPVVLIGHSMGGYVAFNFLQRYSKNVRALVLVATKSGPDTPEAATGRRTTAEKIKTEGLSVLVDAMAPKMPAKSSQDAALLSRIRELMTTSQPLGVRNALLGMAEREDSTPSLKNISVPTLVIAGDEDSIIPFAESKKLAEMIPNAKLETVQKAGHLVAYEKSEAFNEILSEWLARFGPIFARLP